LLLGNLPTRLCFAKSFEAWLVNKHALLSIGLSKKYVTLYCKCKASTPFLETPSLSQLLINRGFALNHPPPSLILSSKEKKILSKLRKYLSIMRKFLSKQRKFPNNQSKYLKKFPSKLKKFPNKLKKFPSKQKKFLNKQRKYPSK